MKGHKIKIIVLIVAIVLILAILIIPLVRKTIILQTIYSKTSKLEETEKNVYWKIDNGEEVAELYFLNDTQKVLLNGKMLGDIVRATEDNPNPGFATRFNYYLYTNFWDTCLVAKDIKIKTVQMNGKKYYEITENCDDNGNPQFPYKTIKYVEKDTGITAKEIRFTKEKTYTITLSYEFGILTEADFLE